MKKTISIILSLVMALTMTMGLDFSAFAIEYDSGDWEYEIINGNKAQITDYWGDDVTSLVIPSRLDGYTVTSIGAKALYNEEFQYVTIPSSVTEILSEAFGSCSNLKSVVVPSSVTTMGTNVFSFCEGLTSATLNCNISVLPEGTFEFCKSLTDVSLSNSITELGVHSFWVCESLQTISLPNNLSVIAESAFMGCTLMNSITFPNTLTTIKDSAFSETSITLFDIPASVTSIGGYAFYDSDNVQRIIIRNPNCYIDQYIASSNAVICGNNVSTAQTYATENYFEFIALEATTCFNRGYHNYIYVDVESTCNSYGYFGYICTDCGREKEMYRREYFSSHNYNGGQYCTVCGSANPYYTPPQAYQPPVNVYTQPVADVYTPTAQVTVVAPKATSIKSLSKGKKSFTVKWKKISSVNGYQIQYSTDKKLKKGCKTYTVKKGSATSATIKKLKGKKKYYVRVRTYKVVAGQKVYSSWSKVKTVTTK